MVQAAPVVAAAAGSRQRAKHVAQVATTAVPWWRQAPGCWPNVLIGPGTESGKEESSSGISMISQECLRVACGLWRMGACCQVWPPEAGIIETKSALSLYQHLGQHGSDVSLGPVLPDFMLSASPASQGPGASSSDTAGSTTTAFRYSISPLSEQGQESMERVANKDAGAGSRKFDDRPRLFEFLDRLARRHPSASLGRAAHHVLPQPSSDF
eukprot:TRINITY_DN15551_c0_g2_i1.p1 TRINITY_DN15551_c0_g2~~TRINITY_DN15551_c0_g2_i1.p1  ORF type:complete len:241 (+),score=59.10 TRINITY_DN15551_c0_g2_i1:90-725(+)